MAGVRVDGLRSRREARSLTRQALAEAARCSISTVTMAERGLGVSTTMIERLAAVLECDPGDLSAPAQSVTDEGQIVKPTTTGTNQ